MTERPRNDHAMTEFPRHSIETALLLLVCAFPLAAQKHGAPPTASLLQDEEPQAPPTDLLTVGMDVFPSAGSGSFFTQYSRLFGTASALDPYVAPHISGRFRLSNTLRLVVFGAINSTGFQDLYDAYTISGTANGDSVMPAAQIEEDFSIAGIPALAGIQYTPFHSQFASYIGAAAGVNFGTVSWTTASRRFQGAQFARPHDNIDEAFIGPAFRIFSGVDLRFDEMLWGSSVFRGIYVEASYFYLPVSQEFFTSILGEGRGLALEPEDETANINLGGFSIGLGVSVQIERAAGPVAEDD